MGVGLAHPREETAGQVPKIRAEVLATSTASWMVTAAGKEMAISVARSLTNVLSSGRKLN